ncbi:hypothetical protein HDV00_012193, partial [Rhizophlyctis rosea]
MHWIDCEWNQRSVLLDFIHLPGKHTGVVMAEVLHDVLSDLGIVVEQTLPITMDSAFNNDTAAAAFEKKMEDLVLICFSHILHLAVTTALKTLKINSLCHKRGYNQLVNEAEEEEEEDMDASNSDAVLEEVEDVYGVEREDEDEDEDEEEEEEIVVPEGEALGEGSGNE